MNRRLVIACDHGGFELKEHLRTTLTKSGVSVVDLGVEAPDSVDYPDYAKKLCNSLQQGDADVGILVCGTGIGMSIAANRHRGIRAALCTDPFTARMSREHNDSNVLCLGGRVVGPSLAEDIVQAFLNGEFAGGRHARRIAKFDEQ